MHSSIGMLLGSILFTLQAVLCLMEFSTVGGRSLQDRLLYKHIYSSGIYT